MNLFIGDWGLGIGDWGLGIGDWGLGPIPNPHLTLLYKNLICKIIILKIFWSLITIKYIFQ